MLLAHEYVHALQYHEHDVAELYEHVQTYDERLGISSMLEGEAELYTDHLEALAAGFDLEDVDWPKAFASYRRLSRRRALAHREPILKLGTFFVYGYGSSYVHAAHRSGGNPAVRALLADPPPSVRAVMAGPSAEPPGGEPWLEPDLDAEAVPADVGAAEGIDSTFVSRGSRHMGSHALWLFIARWNDTWATPDPLEHPAVANLRRDVLTVLRSADDEGTLVTGACASPPHVPPLA